MIEEYEGHQITENVFQKHHEQTPAVQAKFKKEVAGLVSIITNMGNPFTEDNGNLLTIDTKDIMDKVVVDSVKQALQLGKEQYYRFQDERFIKRSVPISEPIKRNKLALFQLTKVSNKTKPQLAILKDDCALFPGCILHASLGKETWMSFSSMKTNHIHLLWPKMGK
ncbi:hypothetical protein DPMN_076756 [Dreissena polymorpha]|uniref:Uncharacterized protein n=1 Tax=Dreissena polymorpha TaxID=45954 RepID=A0A9D4BG12_DREPO|nr:hypothetical protein DPMN_076756 [Dreissena polymorpha]